MQHPAWILIVLGAATILIGVIWLFVPSIPPLGQLPGDLTIERENVRFSFPVTTCIFLSLLLTGILWLVRFLSR